MMQGTEWWKAVEQVMTEHLGLVDDALSSAVREFEQGAYLTSDGFRDRTNDLKGLQALETALLKVVPLLEEVSGESVRRLMRHFHEYGEDDRRRLGNAIYCVIYEKNKILAGIQRARKELSEPDPMIRRTLKQINIEAVQVLDAAIHVWTKHQNRPAPRKALNPATPFGRFIRDLFDACDLKADPKAAFRAWAETYGAAA